MIKWDDELKDFMLSAKKKYRTFNSDNTEWNPTTKMWLERRWVIAILQKFRSKEKAWSMYRYCTQISKELAGVGGPAHTLRVYNILIHSYLFSGMVHLGD